MVNKVRVSALKARTTSDLRQAGIAILGYTAERRDQRAPGPSALAINPYYSTSSGVDDPGNVLAVYLGYKSATKADFPLLMCPMVKKMFPNRTISTQMANYVQNNTLSARSGSGGARVLGHQTANPAIAAANWPIALHELDNYGGAARVWILTNLDYALPKDMKKAGYNGPDTEISDSGWFKPEDLPPEPVWGNSRVRLYFDAHVAFVSRYAP
ncbi:MAG: type II secretion system protein [Opitutaceae bacterium]|nr:type II secretion system protein [Opitutaceae bacterium]